MLVVSGASTGEPIDDDLVCSEKVAESIVAFHGRADCTRLPAVAGQCHDLGDKGWEESVLAPCLAKVDEWATNANVYDSARNSFSLTPQQRASFNGGAQ